MRKVLYVWVMLLSLGMISACSSDDDSLNRSDEGKEGKYNDSTTTLYNQWVLVSYGNGSNEVIKEDKGHYYHITFKPIGGYYSAGRGYGNQMWGEYKCSGNEIQISPPILYVEGSDLDEFFLEHLHDVCTYHLSNNELKLYYFENQFFRFRIKDDKSDNDLLNGWLSEKDIEIASNPNSIVGIWELHTLGYPGSDYEIPLYDRDAFIFNSKGQVKVSKRMLSYFRDFPNEDGEYDYSYDEEKKIIQLCGKTRQCIISDSEMHMDGYHDADREPIQDFIFIKKSI